MQWVRERFLAEIEEISRKFFPSPVAIALTLVEPRAEPAAGLSNGGFRRRGACAGAGSSSGARPTRVLPANPRPLMAPAYEKTRLNPGFTFDNLVTGKANQLARAARGAGVGKPGRVV